MNGDMVDYLKELDLSKRLDMGGSSVTVIDR